MAKTTTPRLHDLSLDELRVKAGQLERQMQEARLQLAAGKMSSPTKIRTDARELARVKTILREKELAAIAA